MSLWVLTTHLVLATSLRKPHCPRFCAPWSWQDSLHISAPPNLGDQGSRWHTILHRRVTKRCKWKYIQTFSLGLKKKFDILRYKELKTLLEGLALSQIFEHVPDVKTCLLTQWKMKMNLCEHLPALSPLASVRFYPLGGGCAPPRGRH